MFQAYITPIVLCMFSAASANCTSNSTEAANQNAVWENASGQSINVVSRRTASSAVLTNSGLQPPPLSNSLLVRSSTGKIGAGKLVKVMAGDRIHTSVQYYYPSTSGSGAGTGLSTLVGGLASVITNSLGSGALVKGAGTALASGVSADPAAVSFFANQNSTPAAGRPKAYLNVVFFDEQFKMDATASKYQQVGTGSMTPGNPGQVGFVAGSAVLAQKSGYCYIYISNESDELVYFDNLTLTHERGHLLEETHYYPFGLTMAGISSRSAGGLVNKKKYNGIEYENSFDLNIGETFFRTHDPQLGRWWQIDPKPSFDVSPYAAMDNNPVSKADFLGDVAVFYNEQGKEIYRKKDGHKYITPTIISDDRLKVFEKSKDLYKSSLKSLQSLGTTYDTKSFSKFFDENSKKFKADFVGKTPLKYAESVKVDGKTVDKNSLKAEAMANTVLKDGVVTVGSNPATSNGSMTGADPDKPGNEPGKTGNIHLHPTDRTMTVDIVTNGLGRQISAYTIYGGSPSTSDHTEYKRSGQGTRFVMVDASNIYLYNADSGQTIKIPRP